MNQEKNPRILGTPKTSRIFFKTATKKGSRKSQETRTMGEMDKAECGILKKINFVI